LRIIVVMGRAIDSTIDGTGRVVIPAEVREKAGLKEGTPLRVTYRDGRIEIEPMPRGVRIFERGHLSVAIPETPSEPLTNERVSETISGASRERGCDRDVQCARLRGRQ
jgi:AbrB family looped-hinge helix DNA binding protein